MRGGGFSEKSGIESSSASQAKRPNTDIGVASQVPNQEESHDNDNRILALATEMKVADSRDCDERGSRENGGGNFAESSSSGASDHGARTTIKSPPYYVYGMCGYRKEGIAEQ